MKSILKIIMPISPIRVSKLAPMYLLILKILISFFSRNVIKFNSILLEELIYLLHMIGIVLNVIIKTFHVAVTVIVVTVKGHRNADQITVQSLQASQSTGNKTRRTAAQCFVAQQQDKQEEMAPVKDIRMIRNKATGGFKDFSFVQFYSPEETSSVYKKLSSNDFRIHGDKITVVYSRHKSDDDYYKLMPYEQRDRRKDFIKKEKKQRQIQIDREKERPLVTLEQLKEKKQQQLKKVIPISKPMNADQSKRRQAEILMKQWEKQLKTQMEVLYLCPLCHRKFKNQEQMNKHAEHSQLHEYRLKKLSLGVKPNGYIKLEQN